MRHFPELHARPQGRDLAAPSPGAPHEVPTVEVLVPLFDARAGLAATLLSLAGQSTAEWTLSVRDDGSQDEGPDLVRDFAAAIPEQRVRLTGGAHRGLARSVMTLLAETDPRASAAAIAVPGCRFGSGTLAQVQAVLEASTGPALVLVRPGWRDGAAATLSFADTLAGSGARRGTGRGQSRGARPVADRLAMARTGALRRGLGEPPCCGRGRRGHSAAAARRARSGPWGAGRGLCARA